MRMESIKKEEDVSAENDDGLQHPDGRVADDENFPCDHCDRMFSDPSNLQRHIRSSHVNSRSHTCTDCGKTFATSSGLKQHQHIHSSVKPFQCEVCLKAYTQFSNLCRHKRMHADCRQQIKCHDCGQNFSTMTSLSKHKRFCEGVLRAGSRLPGLPTPPTPDKPLAPHHHLAAPHNLAAAAAAAYFYGQQHGPFPFYPSHAALPGTMGRTFPGLFSTPTHPVSLTPSSAFSPAKFTPHLPPKLPLSPLQSPQADIQRGRSEGSDSANSEPSDELKSEAGSVNEDEEEERIDVSTPETPMPPPSSLAQSAPTETTTTPTETMSRPAPRNCDDEQPLDLSRKSRDSDSPPQTPRKTHIFGIFGREERLRDDGSIQHDSSPSPSPRSPLLSQAAQPSLPVAPRLDNSPCGELNRENSTRDWIRDVQQHRMTGARDHHGISRPLPFPAFSEYQRVEHARMMERDAVLRERVSMMNSLPNSPMMLWRKMNAAPSVSAAVASLRPPLTPVPPHPLPSSLVFPGMMAARAHSAMSMASIPPTSSSPLKLKAERYSCKFCGKVFPRSANLTRHLRTHTGEQPYSCKFCERSFSISSNLQRHVRNIHQKERPFRCPLCARTFGQQTNLDRHLRKHETDGPDVIDSPPEISIDSPPTDESAGYDQLIDEEHMIDEDNMIDEEMSDEDSPVSQVPLQSDAVGKTINQSFDVPKAYAGVNGLELIMST